jgi:hypothetical protein
MPRWLRLTVAVAMSALTVMEYFRDALGPAGNAMRVLVGVVGWGGYFTMFLMDRRKRGPDGKLVPLDLVGGVAPLWAKVAVPIALVAVLAIQAIETPRELGLLGGTLLMVFYLLAWGGALALYQDARHANGSDELTTLNLTASSLSSPDSN